MVVVAMATKTGRRNGRPPKPIEVHRRNGNPSKKNLNPIPVPEFALAVVDAGSLPEPPAELDDYAAALWLMFWDAGRRHLSEKHDSALIAKLCRAMEKAEQIESWMADDVERWFYATANGQLVTHPLVKQLAELNAQITAWLSLLGFTPSDRARLGLAEIRVANELDQFRQRKSKVVDVEEVRPV
jgi:P27 family predicted phage terminase small subunit